MNGWSKAAANKANSRKKEPGKPSPELMRAFAVLLPKEEAPKKAEISPTTTTKEDEPIEDTIPPPSTNTEPVNNKARFYQSTSVTVEGLNSARLVGYSPEQWKQLLPELERLGFRPY